MARWDWKATSAHVQRSLFDDVKNTGKFQIKRLVDTKIQAARDTLDADIEDAFLAAVDTGGGTDLRDDLNPDNIVNMLPGGSYYNQAPGTYIYGNVDTGTGNPWWQGKYKTANDPATIHLLDDMRNLYNTIGANKEYPNLILCEQLLFEIYEGFALDVTQIVKQESGGLADLGYEVLKFKGKDMVWTSDVTDYTMFMLNTDYIDVVYNPALWFDMTEWKVIPFQTERIAHIIASYNIVSDQLRRHGWLGTYTS
jgi:hypothetical protein